MESVRGLFRLRSGFVRDPFGVRSGSVRDPFGFCSASVRNPFGAQNEKRQSTIGANLPREAVGSVLAKKKFFWKKGNPVSYNMLQLTRRTPASSAFKGLLFNRCQLITTDGYEASLFGELEFVSLRDCVEGTAEAARLQFPCLL